MRKLLAADYDVSHSQSTKIAVLSVILLGMLVFSVVIGMTNLIIFVAVASCLVLLLNGLGGWLTHRRYGSIHSEGTEHKVRIIPVDKVMSMLILDEDD